MKKTVKLLALLLCVAMLFSFASCNKDADKDVPRGMQNATVPGADFRLYIPTSWNPNLAYGVSGGYASLTRLSNVSMVKYPITEEMLTSLPAPDAENAANERIDWFYTTQCRPTLELVSLQGSFVEVAPKAADLINNLNAIRYHEKGNVDGKTVHFVQVLTERANAFYVFSFTVLDELYERLLPDVEKILDNFVFADTPYEPDDYLKSLNTSAKAPEGMQLASNGEVAYRFYVPKTWSVNRDERIFSAYVADDRTSVSVIPYMPDGSNISTHDLFVMSENAMKATAGVDGYELFSHDSEATLDKRPADRYHYRYTVGGISYHYVQVIAAYKDKLYCVTYTALPAYFDAHLAEFEAILAAFEFK
ncbi:MAG: DUF1795 domain-containing protein [Ruminococcaceae bacterium]|nr:DUF1795 domain-containing protein [Oscillospiraceae bacterium]